MGLCRYSALVGLALIVTASSGCVLDWDGARPVRPGDAAVDAAADRGPDRSDAAQDQRRQDLYAGDSLGFDLPAEAAVPDAAVPDAAVPDAAPDVVKPDSGAPCTYVYSGKSDKDASVLEVNDLVKQGYQVHSFVHATDDHAAWLVNSSNSTYLALGATSGALLKTAVDKQIQSSTAWKLVTFLANKDITVWMKKQDTGGKWIYEVVQTTSPLTASNEVSSLAQQNWDVSHYAHHAGKKYAVWLQNGTSYTLLEDDVSTSLATTVNLYWTNGGKWAAKAFLASSGYTGWGKELYKPVYQFYPANQVSTLESWLQSNNSPTSGWTVSMVHADSKHAAWLGNGDVVLLANDGPSLETLINKELAKLGTHTVKRLFSDEHYAVWLSKDCP